MSACSRGARGALVALLLLSSPASALPEGVPTPSTGRRPSASTPPLTRDGVVALAQERAASLIEARFALASAEAALVGAEIPLENPQLTAQGGPRFGDEVRPQVGISAAQPLELGVRRARRVELARRAIERARHDVREARRVATALALEAWIGVLSAKERLLLAQDRLEIARRLLEAATARERAGDASRLELVMARAELAESESALLAHEAEALEALTALARLLGERGLSLDDVVGSLADEVGPAAPAPQEEAWRTRSDVAAAEASARVASAQLSLAEAAWIPRLSVGAGYALEEGEHIGTAIVGVELPLFERGQADALRARAERERSEAWLERTRRTAALEIESAAHRYRLARASAARLVEEGLPRAREAGELATEGYAAGKLDLAATLVLQRNALAIRERALERLHAAALASVELAFALGDVVTPGRAADVSPSTPRRTP